MCFLSVARNEGLNRQAMELWMVSELGVLAPLSSALRRLIDAIFFLSIVYASRFDPLFPYDAYYQRDEVDWSVVDLCDQNMLYDIAGGYVDPLQQKVVCNHKHALGHRISDRIFGLVPVQYLEGPYLRLDKALQFV